MKWQDRVSLIKNSFLYALSQGIRYYREPRYRRQVKNNVRCRHLYGAFLSNRISLREALIRRDGKKCLWCKSHLHRSDMTIDHIVPVSKGGLNKKSNLQILCNSCHIAKTEHERGGVNKYALSGFENKPFADAFKKTGHALSTTNKN